MSTTEDRIAELERRLGELESVREIQELKYQYAAYCDDNYDPDGIASLFTEDGRWIVDGVGGNNEGREEIREHFRALSGPIPWALHYMIAPSITINPDGDSATGTFYLLCLATIARTDDPSEFDAVLITIQYTDKFLRQDGTWLFEELMGKTHHVSDWTEGWVRQPLRP
ncbi:MAG: nuclear transport factor 2 family protein [Acidimicrobiales bacterium]